MLFAHVATGIAIGQAINLYFTMQGNIQFFAMNLCV